MFRDTRKDTDSVETDERFPSGPWTGFWLQRAYPNRQWMANLNLRFQSGSVEGTGSDIVGDFAITGTYDVASGDCILYKHYLGMHTVTYTGKNENDGKWVWGVWTMTSDRGGFHLWPKGTDDPTVPKLRARRKVPVEEPVAAR